MERSRPVRQPIPQAALYQLALSHIAEPTPHFATDDNSLAKILQDDESMRPIDAFFERPQNRPSYVQTYVDSVRWPGHPTLQHMALSCDPDKAEKGLEEDPDRVANGARVRIRFDSTDEPTAAQTLHLHPYESRQIDFFLRMSTKMATAASGRVNRPLLNAHVFQLEEAILARVATVAESHRVWMVENGHHLQPRLELLDDLRPEAREELWLGLRQPHERPGLTTRLMTARSRTADDASEVIGKLRTLQAATFEQATQTVASLGLTHAVRMAYELGPRDMQVAPRGAEPTLPF